MTPRKVMVLAGGPDRERAVSLQSGAAVEQALRQAGHRVRRCDITPDHLEALELWSSWAGDIMFPLLHGPWGEGGPLQQILDDRNIPYIGSRAEAASLCMDKHRTKEALRQHGLPTPPHELIGPDRPPSLPLPLVMKALCQGSSIDLFICHDDQQAHDAHRHLTDQQTTALAEQFITGKEFTVAVVAHTDGHDQPLAPIWIKPNRPYYDYQAKYVRHDTRYVLDPHQIDLPSATLSELKQLALEAHKHLGCRHMSRVDFIVDQQNEPWILEVNTIPGFTTHSLLPKAASAAGWSLADLADRLVRVASEQPRGPGV